MDVNTVADVIRQPPRPPGSIWRDGDAWLAGGTWIFSDNQPRIRRLIDLESLSLGYLDRTDAGLEIGATCTIARLHAFCAPDWAAAGLFATCCEAFLASFKVWNSATVGGNVCLSLPAGPMITMAVALEASYSLWAPDGSERIVDSADFVTGNHANILMPGELLRGIHIPIVALRKRHAHRRFSLTRLGRSTIFMIATQTPGASDLRLTITAATTHPILLRFDTAPGAEALQDRIDELPEAVWFDDPNGTPDHRRHLARYFAEELRMELGLGDQQ